MGLLRKAGILFRQLRALDPDTVDFEPQPSEVPGETILACAWPGRRQMQIRQEYQAGPWTWIFVDHEGGPLDFSAGNYEDRATCEDGAREYLREISSADAA